MSCPVGAGGGAAVVAEGKVGRVEVEGEETRGVRPPAFGAGSAGCVCGCGCADVTEAGGAGALTGVAGSGALVLAVSAEVTGGSAESTWVLFTPSFRDAAPSPAVVLTLEAHIEPPEGVAVLDLVARRVLGNGGEVLEAARELCRKRGIRFEPGPWRYRGTLL